MGPKIWRPSNRGVDWGALEMKSSGRLANIGLVGVIVLLAAFSVLSFLRWRMGSAGERVRGEHRMLDSSPR